LRRIARFSPRTGKVIAIRRLEAAEKIHESAVGVIIFFIHLLTSRKVGSATDTTKPLTQLGLPGSVNLNGGSQRVTFSLGASDDLSGLDRVSL
jgi:hypothetical protein